MAAKGNACNGRQIRPDRHAEQTPARCRGGADACEYRVCLTRAVIAIYNFDCLCGVQVFIQKQVQARAGKSDLLRMAHEKTTFLAISAEEMAGKKIIQIFQLQQLPSKIKSTAT